MFTALLQRLTLLIILLLAAPPTFSKDAAWLLIDGTTATLSVMVKDKVITRFTEVAFGRLGTKPLHFKGDDSTPLGEYRIDGINTQSQYDLFLSLNYPTIAHAKKALDLGKISKEHYLAVFNAETHHQRPPYTTPLGGMIGIHGIGKGSLATHRKYNWTRGCVALDNEQIHALLQYAYIGMRVVIK